MLFRKVEDEYVMRLITEMPQESDDVRSDIPMADIIKTYNNFDPIEETEGGRLYLTFHKVKNVIKNATYLIIDSDYNINMLYKFEPFGNRIKTMGTKSSLKYKGIFEKFFINTLLPTYSTVESDFKLSNLGLKFWKKLMTKYSNLFYYLTNYKTGHLLELKDPKELDDYFGPSESFQNFTFIVSNKRLL